MTAATTIGYRENRPDPEREYRVMPHEKDHYRGELFVGDIVRGQHGTLARITAWDHTWSHLTGGRLVHIEPMVSYPGTDVPDGATPYMHMTSWEADLRLAEPGDIAAHVVRKDGQRSQQHVQATWLNAY